MLHINTPHRVLIVWKWFTQYQELHITPVPKSYLSTLWPWWALRSWGSRCTLKSWPRILSSVLYSLDYTQHFKNAHHWSFESWCAGGTSWSWGTLAEKATQLKYITQISSPLKGSRCSPTKGHVLTSPKLRLRLERVSLVFSIITSTLTQKNMLKLL